jgi:hypothetical protein
VSTWLNFDLEHDEAESQVLGAQERRAIVKGIYSDYDDLFPQ